MTGHGSPRRGGCLAPAGLVVPRSASPAVPSAWKAVLFLTRSPKSGHGRFEFVEDGNHLVDIAGLEHFRDQRNGTKERHLASPAANGLCRNDDRAKSHRTKKG